MRPTIAIGALLTLATLGIDPFLQNIPSYPIKLVDAAGVASVNVATYFKSTTSSIVGGAQTGSSDYVVLDATTKGAFYSGIFNTSSNNVIVPSCPSGNCTWSDYTSLGVCSACADLSRSLNSTLDPEGFNGESFIYTLPNGLSGSSSSDQMISSTTYGTIKFPNLQSYSIADLSAIYWVFAEENDEVSPPSYATECILYFCTQTYPAKVSQGDFYEELVSSFPNTSTSATEAQEAIALDPSTASLPPSVPASLQVEVVMGAGNITISTPGLQTKHSIDNQTVIVLREWVQSILPANLDRENTKSTISDVGQVLFTQQANSTGVMQLIATSLTAHIRNLAGETALGNTQLAIVVVQARWSWIIYPLAILALALAFVFTTMFMSAKRRMPAWKSSALPGLVYPMDQATSTAITDRGPQLRDMEKASKRHKVAMLRYAEGWTMCDAGTLEMADRS